MSTLILLNLYSYTFDVIFLTFMKCKVNLDLTIFGSAKESCVLLLNSNALHSSIKLNNLWTLIIKLQILETALCMRGLFISGTVFARV